MKENTRVQKIALVGILTALSLGIYVIESQVPIPNYAGVKLGLANVVTLCAMLFVGRAAAGLILGARIVLAAAFYGTFISFMFSVCGGFAAYMVMCFLVERFDKKQIWVVSVFGALAHNAGQLFVVVVVLTPNIWAFVPYLVISGIAAGTLTGLVAQRLWFSPLRRLKVRE